MQPGNVNINFTNLTNSLIVTQQDPNHSKISISKKIPITANHRKTKSHGGAGKIFPVKQGLIENFTKTGNQFYNLKGQK